MAFGEERDEEYDWDSFRWGPDGTLDADDLEREIEESLGGKVEGKVGIAFLDDGTMRAVVYDNVGLDVVRTLAKRGAFVPGHRWGEAAIALMERHPDSRLDAYVECCQDEEGWYAAVRTIRVFTREPTRADVEAARDLVSTFLAMTPDGRKLSQSCSSHWFEDLLDAGAYDWRGETRAELEVAHELPIPRHKRPGRE